MRHCLAALLFVAACFSASVNAATYSANYIFGDSLSDTGNLYLLSQSLHAGNPAFPVLPQAPYFDGRFSNGPNYAELFSADLGLPALPSLAGGTNYAYGGARTSYHQISSISSVASFDAQIGSYLDTHAVADANALFTINIGSNDLSDAIGYIATGNSASAMMVFNGAVQSISADLSHLIASGARTFVMPTITDLGLTPDVTSNGSAQLDAAASGISVSFNQAVNAVLGSLSSATPGLTFYRPDLYSLLDQAVADPSAYGFTNVTDACFSGAVGVDGTVCATPGTYLFWDGEHPTTVAHSLIADAVLAAVPEPGVYVMLLVGLGVIGLARRRTAVLI
jgi:outer membrane lipase/esterase